MPYRPPPLRNLFRRPHERGGGGRRRAAQVQRVCMHDRDVIFQKALPLFSTILNFFCITNDFMLLELFSPPRDTLLLRSQQQQRSSSGHIQHHQNRRRRIRGGGERDDGGESGADNSNVLKSARRWRSALGSWWRRRSRASRSVTIQGHCQRSELIGSLNLCNVLVFCTTDLWTKNQLYKNPNIV